MNRSIIPALLIAIIAAFSAQANAQTKDPTDLLFEEILAETINSDSPTEMNQVRTPEVQAPAAQRTGPVVTHDWGTSAQQPTFTTPQYNAANAVQAQQTSGLPPSANFAAEKRVQSVTGSVAMDLIAPRDINMNQTATIRVQLKNVGEDSLNNVKFIAQLPEHARFETARPQPTNVEDGQIEFSSIQLASRSNSFIEIDVVPTEKAPINISTQIQYVNEQQIGINVRQPELDIQVAGPEQLVLGETKLYQITVTNRGDGTATNIRFTSEFPGGLQKLRATNTSIPQLAPGQSAQIQLTAQGLESGSKEVQFQFASSGLDTMTRKTTVTVIQPELELAATGPSVNFLRRDGVYRIEISNPGQVDCTAVNLALTVPTEMSVSTISREASYDEASRQLTWAFDRIPAGQTQVVQLKAQCTEEGQHSCVIEINSDQTVAKEFRINTMVATRADVSLNISNETGPAQIGAETAFDIVVENRGSRSAEDVQVVVELPVSLSPVLSDDYTINQYENSIQFSLADVKAGEKKSLRFAAVGSAQGEHVVRSRLTMSGSARQIIAEDSVYVFESDQARVGEKLEPQIRR